MPLNNTANTIEKIVVKLKFFNLNIAKSAPNKAPIKLSNVIITKIKLIKHHSLPTGPTSKSRNLFIVYIVLKEKIFFTKSFCYNYNNNNNNKNKTKCKKFTKVNNTTKNAVFLSII